MGLYEAVDASDLDEVGLLSGKLGVALRLYLQETKILDELMLAELHLMALEYETHIHQVNTLIEAFLRTRESEEGLPPAGMKQFLNITLPRLLELGQSIVGEP